MRLRSPSSSAAAATSTHRKSVSGRSSSEAPHSYDSGAPLYGSALTQFSGLPKSQTETFTLWPGSKPPSSLATKSPRSKSPRSSNGELSATAATLLALSGAPVSASNRSMVLSSISYRANALSMSAASSIVSRVGMVSARAEETSAPSAKSQAASARGRRVAETRAEGVERMLEGKGLG